MTLFVLLIHALAALSLLYAWRTSPLFTPWRTALRRAGGLLSVLGLTTLIPLLAFCALTSAWPEELNLVLAACYVVYRFNRWREASRFD